MLEKFASAGHQAAGLFHLVGGDGDGERHVVAFLDTSGIGIAVGFEVDNLRGRGANVFFSDAVLRQEIGDGALGLTDLRVERLQVVARHLISDGPDDVVGVDFTLGKSANRHNAVALRKGFETAINKEAGQCQADSQDGCFNAIVLHNCSF